jgi:preprotein translocase subunit SecG
MSSLFYIVHFAVCVLLVLIVLMQDGKAGGLTSVADSSKAVFGAKGAGDFLSRVTTYLAVFFMITSLSLTIINSSKGKSVSDDYLPPVQQSAVGAQPAEGDVTLPDGSKASINEVMNPGDFEIISDVNQLPADLRQEELAERERKAKEKEQTPKPEGQQ